MQVSQIFWMDQKKFVRCLRVKGVAFEDLLWLVATGYFSDVTVTSQFLWKACTLSCIISILCNWVTFSNILAVSSSFDSLIEFDCVLKLPVWNFWNNSTCSIRKNRFHYTNLSIIKAFPRHLMAFMRKFLLKILQLIFGLTQRSI